MSQKYEDQSCQWYGVKRIKSYFGRIRKLQKKVWSTSLLPQVVLISSIKPISSSMFLHGNPNFSQRPKEHRIEEKEYFALCD